MKNTDKKNKRLKLELIVLICITCIWVIKLVTIGIDNTKAEMIMPDSAEAYLNLGNSYYDANNIEKAIESYKTAINLDPMNMEAYCGLADCYCEKGMITESIDIWKQVIEANPEYKWAYISLAFNYIDLAKYEEAIVELKKLIKFEPEISGLHVILGDTYDKANQYEQALIAYQNAISLDPNNAQAYYQLGNAYLKKGERDLALEQYETLKTLDKDLANELKSIMDTEESIELREQTKSNEGVESEQLKVDTEKMQKLDAEIRDIDVYVTSNRAEIEAWYSESLADIKAEGEKRLTQLEDEKKAAYLRSLQQMKNTTEVSEKQVTEDSYGRANVYVRPFGQAVIDSYETTYGKEIETTQTSVEGDPTADYEATLYRLKKSEQATEQELWARKRQLDAARQYKLMYLEEEAQRRRNVLEWKKRCVLKKIQQSVSDNETPLSGVVPRIQAICFSNNAQSIIYVQGRSAREGDIVNGFKILKIFSDKVEFEKNGQSIVGIFQP